jgi:hypothetical protein
MRVICPAGGVYLIALSSRFAMTCRRRVGSADTHTVGEPDNNPLPDNFAATGLLAPPHPDRVYPRKLTDDKRAEEP